MSVDEEIVSDKKPAIKFMKSVPKSMVEGVKEMKKNVSPETYLKNTAIVKKKTPKKSHVSKKRNVEVKIIEKKCLNVKLFQSSDSRKNVEANVQDIVSTVTPQ